jgi:hypothetical protein
MRPPQADGHPLRPDPPEADTAAGDQPGSPASDVCSMGWEQREPSQAKAAVPPQTFCAFAFSFPFKSAAGAPS